MYRIIYIEDVGYIPQFDKGEIYGWQPIEADGSDESVMSIALSEGSEMAHTTEAEAGKVINLHSRNRSGKVIWTSVDA